LGSWVWIAFSKIKPFKECFICTEGSWVRDSRSVKPIVQIWCQDFGEVGLDRELDVPTRLEDVNSIVQGDEALSFDGNLEFVVEGVE
jgi:hypothetical protein